MTISEAISRIDDLKSNTYSREEKIRWLSAVDAMVSGQILAACQEGVTFEGYTPAAPDTAALLVPEPYDDLYLHWLSAQMDLYNGEYTRFNNSMALFQARFRDYENCYRREHMPLGKTMKYR